MRAIVVGYGGIGKNVYVPQLEQLGYKVYIVDPAVKEAAYATVNDVPKNLEFDVAVVCCPNVHHLNAVLELSDVCKNILVEKPGLANTRAWLNTVHRLMEKGVWVSLVKNNLYRKDIDKFESLVDLEEVSKIEINWINKDRIPNPGGWFTNKELAFGGVTHDLFPHLYCFMFALVPFHLFNEQIPETFKMQRWDLHSLGDNTDYGTINRSGVYNVCDYAEAHYYIHRDDEPLPVSLKASWKEGYDDQAIHIYYKSGGSLRVEFGLCPDDAYGRMIESFVNGKFMGYERQTWIEQDFDKWIHAQLEMFDREN